LLGAWAWGLGRYIEPMKPFREQACRGPANLYPRPADIGSYGHTWSDHLSIYGVRHHYKFR
jgi:hypothetical protein